MAQISDFSTEKQALLAALLKRKGSTPKTYPLSFAQQRLWFLQQLEPENAFYNVPIAVRLSGPLVVAALEQALVEIARRHATLRTTFVTGPNGQPLQAVAPLPEISLPVVDLAHLPPSEREVQVKALTMAEAQQPFDLTRGPLVRTKLLRVDEQDHILLVTMHHIISDGWSITVLIREATLLYEAFARGESSPLPPLLVQYVDYAHWQRQQLQASLLEKQLAYWKRQLAGPLPVLQLPTDRPRPAVQTYRGAGASIRLSRRLSEALKALSQREGATLFMTLLAAFQTLLSRYSGQEDLTVGTPIAGRNREEFEGLIGFFANTLVLRADLSGNPTFLELLQRVRETALGAYAHQDLPFERLVEAINPERSLSFSQLFQVMFVLQNTPESRVQLSDLSVQMVGAAEQVAKFDLSLEIQEGPNGLAALMTYNVDLFDATTVERMLMHYGNLLEAIVADPSRPLLDLPMIDEGERHCLVDLWNQTGESFPQDRCIHEQFELQVERTPDALAVIAADEELTYRELNRRANQLAQRLRACGVGPDLPVGLCLERSAAMLVGLLGILKAGGAYVPLDPAYPRERLAWILEDAQIPVLVTTATLLDRLPEVQAELICLDRDQERLAQESDENPASGLTPRNLAYIIFTSGSTGRPKGVMVEHRSVLNLATSLQRAIYADQSSGSLRVTLNAPIAFDSSVKQWLMLMQGHTLCVIPEELRRDPSAFVAFIRHHRVDVLDCTPSLLRLLLSAGLQDEQSHAPRLALIGGEAIDESLWQELAAATRTEFYNVYGPTEATVDTTVARIRTAGPRPVIGRPLSNVQVYVLDPQRQLAPLGVPGELYIGGEGVSRGYLNRHELTAERFVVNPFGPGRLYRTGDLVRYRADGHLEFLGRVDHQVKIRGFRIELGEVEEVLTRHPAVKHAAVLTWEAERLGQQLVAYVAFREKATGTAPEIRRYLREQLPDYMVPAAIMLLPALPLSPNGKVDRKALPAPNLVADSDAYLPPSTPTEELLAGLWAELLGLERVGADDNFFALGGHSLLATQLVSKVREVLQVELPLRALFEEPTVAGLATRVDTLRRSAPGEQRPPVVPVPRDGEIPLSYAQQRIWFLEQLAPGTATYNMPFAIRMEGELNLMALEQTLTEIVRRHESLRTTFRLVNGEPVQVIGELPGQSLQVIDLTGVREAEVEVQMQAHLAALAGAPMDLEQGPLFQATLLRLRAQEHVLLVVMHHIISDGWSIGLLVKECGALYAAFVAGEPSPLAPLSVQAADWAVWQRQWLAGGVLEAQLAYWKQQFAGELPVLQLPTKQVRSATQTVRGDTVPVQLPGALTQRLRGLCRQEGVTLYMALLGAFQALLHRYTGQESITVGSPIANRNTREIEGLIGCFINTLALRTDLSGRPSYRELLRRVREVTLGAYAHQDLPFERVVEELQPERDPGRTPLFQVMFVLQNAPAGDLAMPGLKLSTLATETRTAKFELTLNLAETPDGIAGELEYNADLFEHAFVEQMTTHLANLLAGVTTDADRPIAEIPLLAEGELNQLLVAWNETASGLAHDRCIHQLFTEQAAQRPDAVALVVGTERLTYRALDERSNRLANYLRGLGVGPEVLVGICMERTSTMVVGMLGILKAGGAYVPLDPAYPRERLGFILEDTQAPVLLTQTGLLGLLPEYTGSVLCLDRDWAEIERSPDHAPESGVTPTNLGYVIYTSGSTGRPKGVAIEHRSAVTFIRWARTVFTDAELAGVLFSTSICFDLSVFELFVTLSSGGKVILAQNALELPTLPAVNEVTLINTVPSAGLALLRMEGIPSSVCTVNLAGEPLPNQLAQDLYERAGVKHVYNLYGPSEDTTYSTVALVPRGNTGAVTIGRPISDTQLYVLDAQRQPVPIGVLGELYIGGDGLARGYLNRLELTAERFIANPFGPGRLYRTGDLVRYRMDGALEYLGRADNQVKIRGFRIELGEIEEALSRHAAVEQVAVLTLDGGPAGKQIVAYVVPRAEATATATELRRYLKERLPEHMVPAAFMLLPQLPLTPNGKVDRKALPAPDLKEEVGAYLAPRDEFEQTIAAIWEEVLGVRPIGVHDDFFALGGHSLLVVRLLARIGEVTGRRLSLSTFFQEPTVERVAVLLRSDAGTTKDWSALVPIQTGGDRPPFFCVHAVEGTALPFVPLAEQLGPDQPFYGLQARGLEGGEPAERVEEMAASYLTAVRSVQPYGPYLLGGWSLGGTIAFEMARQLRADGEEVALLALFDALAPAYMQAWVDPSQQSDEAILTQILAAEVAGTPEGQIETDPAQGLSLVRVFRANHRAVRAYQPASVDCRMVLFRTESTLQRVGQDETFGWQELATTKVEVCPVPGEHLSIFKQPYVAEVARHLADFLVPTETRSADPIV